MIRETRQLIFGQDSFPLKDQKAREDIALDFSEDTAYDVGDLVLYDGYLYKFTSAHSAGAWVGTDAVQITICGELKGVVSSFNTALAGKSDTSHTHAYVPTAGGTMTGELKFSKDNKTAIGYQGTQAYYTMIRFVDNASDNYGNGISVGGGGLTIIGGGESAENAQGAFSTGGDERLILCNDGGIDFWTNCQSGHASATKRTIDTSGNFNGNAANVTGTVAIGNGGTGATTAANACANLGAVKKSGDTMSGTLNIMGGMAMRATNANRAATGTGGIYQFKATSSMTSNKPSMGDGHILGFEWDNTGGWDSQLYLSNATGQMMTRTMSNGTWQAWQAVCYQGGISTTDLTAGSSNLANNLLYFVYV